MKLFEYITKHYGVTPYIGQKVIVDGKEGVIVADRGSSIGVNFYTSKPNHISNCHPTWEVVYCQENGDIRASIRIQKETS